MTRRLLLTYLTFALLILVALEVPLGWVYHRGETRRAFAELEHDAEVLAAFIDTALTSGRPDRVALLSEETARRLGGQVDVVDGRGDLLAGTRPQLHPPGRPASDIRAALDGQGQVSIRTAEHAGVAVMSVAVPVHPGVAARGAVRVTVPTAAVTSRIHRFWGVLAAAGAGVLLAAALLAFALARWISRPVRVLERATRRLPDGALPPATTTGPPELRRLAATFHATAGRMHALLESQRSFVGHASHQLKTPLAAVRLRLENLEPHLATGAAPNLRAALTETDRLAHLVETLLAMARADHLACDRVALAGAVADRIDLWSPLAAAQDVTLTADGPDGVTVRAVPGAVGQIVDNLVSNALRVAPAGTAVRISWRCGPGDTVELHVADAGPGLDAEQRIRAFDPFWRGPGAPNGGSGLGLALVRKLAEAGGGRAALSQAGGTGVDVVVTFAADGMPGVAAGRSAR